MKLVNFEYKEEEKYEQNVIKNLKVQKSRKSKKSKIL